MSALLALLSLLLVDMVNYKTDCNLDRALKAASDDRQALEKELLVKEAAEVGRITEEELKERLKIAKAKLLDLSVMRAAQDKDPYTVITYIAELPEEVQKKLKDGKPCEEEDLVKVLLSEQKRRTGRDNKKGHSSHLGDDEGPFQDTEGVTV